MKIASMHSEAELINQCIKGVRTAQQALYDRHCARLMAVCLRYAKSGPEAEDILQEGFLKIFNSVKSFRFEASLTTWMTRIIVNTALNHQRSKLYMLPMVDVTEAGLQEDEKISLADFHFSELVSMIQSLPDGCRVVFNLFAIEGYGHKEIGEMLSISEGTSKSQYNRAKNLLRAKLEHVRKDYAKLGEIGI
jgi:RNA polymerase sigma-70 factor (ECF subfamily)